MKDVLGSLRILPLLVAALATGLGIGTGWTLNDYLRGEPTEEPEGIEFELDLLEWDGAEESESEGIAPEAMDFTAMLETLEERGMRVISERALLSWNRAVIENDGRLAEPVARALLLDEDQVEGIDQAIFLTAQRLRTIELDLMEVESSASDHAVFTFESYPRQGEIVRRALQRRILEELGERDGAFLWNLMTKDGAFSKNDYWGAFGAGETRVTFESMIIEEMDGSQWMELSYEYGPRDAGEATPGSHNRTRFNYISIYPDHDPAPLSELAGRHAFLYGLLDEEMRRFFAAGQ